MGIAKKPIKEEFSAGKNPKLKFTIPRGMKDILPHEYKYWDMVITNIKKMADVFNFEYIETPILEYEKLFEKGTGETTDIVKKEMFTLTTKGGDKLALRPEGTPSVARSYIANMTNWSLPVKLCSYGSMFRYERPQSGRKREFRQFNFEVIGAKSPIVDAQLINLAWKVFLKLKLTNISVQINSVGCKDCRKDYKTVVVNYFKSKKEDLCEDCLERFFSNPLRILDCKNKKCQIATAEAPQIVDYLCKECHDHLMSVLEYLDELEITYFLNPKIVRGLDYYTKTVFEIWSEEENFKEAKVAFCGGGRYDGLISSLGGKDTPAAGFGFGMDRIIMLMEHCKIKAPKKQNFKVFLVALGAEGKKKSLKIFDNLVNAGISVAEAFAKESLKAQLKAADKEGSSLSLIIGQKEAIDETVIVRDMASGAQEIVSMGKIIQEVKRMLKNI